MVRQKNTAIHIGLDYNEAVESKKATLLIEKSLLETIKKIRAYNLLRKREFSLKRKIKLNLILLKELIKEMQATLPKEEIKKIEEKTKERLIKTPEEVKYKIKEEEIKRNNSIERELFEINEKLSRLN